MKGVEKVREHTQFEDEEMTRLKKPIDNSQQGITTTNLTSRPVYLR